MVQQDSMATPPREETLEEPPILRLPSFTKRKNRKPNLKKQQALQRKYLLLRDKLNPIPFSPPSHPLPLPSHPLLYALGLSELANAPFDPTIRPDLIAQLVATYDPKNRCSYVNAVKIMVNRADLGRAFKLPNKKEMDAVQLDEALLTDESIGFLLEFVSSFVLLHEDTWMTPKEVLDWIKVIKDGHPERVDWAGLLWFMVEKELAQGENLVHCYYASHLQYLVKSQHEELVLEGGPCRVDLDGEDADLVVDCTGKVEEVEPQAEVELVESVNLNEEQNQGAGEGGLDVEPIPDVPKEDVDVMPERLNIELTLGEDAIEQEDIENVEEERVHDTEMMELEEGNEHVDDDKTEKWQLNTENTVGGHTLQMCSLGVGSELYNYESINEGVEDIEEEEEKEEAEDTFDIMHNHETLGEHGLTGNFLQAMQENKLPFSSPEQFHDQPDIGLVTSRNDLQHDNSAGPSFYGNGGKRPVEHMPENDLDCKRSRVDGPWNNESPDFVMCMDGIQQFITRATMMYEVQEQSLEQSNTNQQILIDEMQKRDSLIEQLHKRCEEMQEKDEEIYRLERELYVMGNLLDGYREALKGTQKAFAEYKQRVPQPEESIYKDAGPGGLMLTSEAIERRRLKREEEHRANRLILEHKAKEAEEGYACMFAALLGSVHKLDSRIVGLKNEMMKLKKLSINRKATETEQAASKETSMLEQPAPREIDMAENCEGTENEELVSREAGVVELPASSEVNIPDNCEGTGNEQPVSNEISTPDKHQGMETEQN